MKDLLRETVPIKILIVGGTGFIGPHLVRWLAERGHSMAVYHRGKSRPDLPAEHILGDRRDLPKLRLKADLVIDLILSSAAQAQATMDAFRGIARRVVAASSMDVYRACAVMHRLEEGPLEPVPLTEDSGLRTKLQTYPAELMTVLRKFFGWIDEDYDKIPVERTIMGDSELPATICRLPIVYGPGDYARRSNSSVRKVRCWRFRSTQPFRCSEAASLSPLLRLQLQWASTKLWPRSAGYRDQGMKRSM